MDSTDLVEWQVPSCIKDAQSFLKKRQKQIAPNRRYPDSAVAQHLLGV